MRELLVRCRKIVAGRTGQQSPGGDARLETATLAGSFRLFASGSIDAHRHPGFDRHCDDLVDRFFDFWMVPAAGMAERLRQIRRTNRDGGDAFDLHYRRQFIQRPNIFDQRDDRQLAIRVNGVLSKRTG